MGSKINLEKSGAAQAAILAAMFGILTLALVNLGTEISEVFKMAVHNIGKYTLLGAEGIGPYSGKETISTGVWLVSWFFLHRLLRGKEWNSQTVLTLFLVGVALATTLVWPPATHWTVHLLTKG